MSRGTLFTAIYLVSLAVFGTDSVPVYSIDIPTHFQVAKTYDSLIDLLADKKPTIWDYDRECCHLLFVKIKKGSASFTADAAYRIRQGGKQFWACISRDDLKNSKTYKHHVRFTRTELPEKKARDGNRSYFELLGSEGGRRLFNIVHLSNGGGRNYQEADWSVLVYVDREGIPHLACRKGFVQRICGPTLKTHTSYKTALVWNDDERQPLVLSFTVTAQNFEHPFAIYQEGSVSGSIPAMFYHEKERYILGNGRLTLNELAASMQATSFWSRSDKIKLIFQKCFREVNPGVDVNTIVPKGTKVMCPDGRTITKNIYGK